jgi:Cof subfamily protein (haloacid dehalogenase superfamily)
MKRAVFFDIDGTLWDEKFIIPQTTRQAIQKLRENGHLTFICSGRTKGFIRDERLLSLGFHGIVAGCGTYIECDGNVLYYHRLDNQLVKQSLEVLKKYRMTAILEGKNCLYLDSGEHDENFYVKRLKEDLKESVLPISGNEDSWEVSKFSASALDDSYLLAKQELKEHFDCLVHGRHVMEFVPNGFSKASGIKRTCEYLDIPLENTYAFGDSVNDLDMLSYVAHGVAMGNGTDDAKQAAEYVTSSLHEDGIMRGLEYYGLI